MKTHPTDLASLIPGVLFILIATVALAGGLTVDLLAADWVWPSALIILGLLVLATAGLGGRGRRATDEADERVPDPAGPAGHPADPADPKDPVDPVGPADSAVDDETVDEPDSR